MKSLQIAIIAKVVDIHIIEEIKKQFDTADIIVVTPDSQRNIEGIKFYNDSDFLVFNDIKKKLKSNRVGWYYQQLLKYTIVNESSYENVLIIDGDSIVTSKVLESNAIFTTGAKAQNQYVLFNNSIFNFCGDELSYVTNQMLFNKIIFDQMIVDIEKNHNNSWFDVIIAKINDNSGSIFSEYQLYGSYAVHTYQTKILELKVFRRMDCINDSVLNALKKYDLVAFESHHKTGIIRKARANILYKLGVCLG